MARAKPNQLPDALERRTLLYGKHKKPPDYAAYGQRYLEAGRTSDALDFFERIPDAGQRQARIRGVRDQAVDGGDAFLLARIHALEALDEPLWRKALAAARAKGRPRYALKLARRLGDEAEVASLERELGIVREPPPQPAAPAAVAPAATPAGIPQPGATPPGTPSPAKTT